MSTAQPANTAAANTPTDPDHASEGTEPPARNHGLGRIIVAIYGVFALSATARAGYQMYVDFDRAPLAYLLSALAAVVYIVATISLAKTGPKAYLVSTSAIIFELIGVLVIGAMTELNPELFPVDTVWSHFGSGYGYVPLVLPIIGLAWLFYHRRRR
ncbi:hypothetical protein [Micrococcoides hystricis]|uniref:Integral membrane protein n=1 Tax=Micrococcoides hystricis TaxID=1572761 RepID=A0ABV6P8P1_9MICC